MCSAAVHHPTGPAEGIEPAIRLRLQRDLPEGTVCEELLQNAGLDEILNLSISRVILAGLFQQGLRPCGITEECLDIYLLKQEIAARRFLLIGPFKGAQRLVISDARPSGVVQPSADTPEHDPVVPFIRQNLHHFDEEWLGTSEITQLHGEFCFADEMRSL